MAAVLAIDAKSRPARRWLGDGLPVLVLLAPVLVLFALAVVYPLAETIRLSFFDIRGMGAARFIGWDNYFNLFADADFRKSLWTTLVWSLTTTTVSVSIGWLLAMLCSFAPGPTTIPRVMIFAAYGMSEAVTGFAWVGIYRPDESGLLNTLGAMLGLAPQAWLGDETTALGAVSIAYAWAQTGLPLMLCFAAAQAVPKSVLEAAYMDGARPASVVRHILMPLTLPGVRVAIFMNLLSSLRAFDTIYVMTGGGPARSTETIGYFMFRVSMNQFKLGYGAAATIVLLIAVGVVSLPAIIQRTSGAR